MPTKVTLRRAVLARLESQSPRLKRQKSLLIHRKLLALPEFQTARSVCFYVSLPMEVDTRGLIQKALGLGKRVAVPISDLSKRALRFYEISDLKKDLKKGSLGILEPDPMRTQLLDVKDIDLIVVPGVAFDAECNRLGRGAGFYDRFLKKIGKKIKKVGLAFSEQMVPKVPVEKHDIRLDYILTDKI